MAGTKPKVRIAYIIQESGWDYNDEYYYRGGNDDRVIKAFSTRAKAEAYQRQRELKARRGKNPFEWGTYFPTSRTEKEFCQFVTKELGLPAPRFEHGCYQWMIWWSEHEDELTAEQLTKIWDAMDLVHFFEVVEIEVEG